MNNELDDILASIRQQYEEDTQKRLLEDLYFEEDMLYFADPRNFGPDWDSDE
jgi:hypothetical protein